MAPPDENEGTDPPISAAEAAYGTARWLIVVAALIAANVILRAF